MKYWPEFPERFGTITEAREFMDGLTQWYDHEHHHTGLGLHTPADVHYGLVPDKAVQRRAVLDRTRTQHPEWFATSTAPKILTLPDTVWINKPTESTETSTASEEIVA